MKTLRSGLIVLLTFVAIAVKAQSVDDIIAKHINALGGKGVLENTKSVYVESSVDISGNEAPTVTYILFGKGSRTELDFAGQKVIQTVSEKNGGWAVTPAQAGAVALPDDQTKASKMGYETGGPLYNYAAKGSKVALLGKDTANGGAYKVELTTKDGLAVTYYINAQTYYIDKAVNKMSVGGQEMETTATFSDYRKADGGYVLSWSQKIALPQMTLVITNKKVEVNKAIDEGLFEMPKN